MAKPRLAGEKWTQCDRCDFDHPMSELTVEPQTGLLVCTTEARCLDEPDRDFKKRQRGGLLFSAVN